MLDHSRASSGEKVLTDINALCDEYLRLAYHGMRAKNNDFNAALCEEEKVFIECVRRGVEPCDLSTEDVCVLAKEVLECDRGNLAGAIDTGIPGILYNNLAVSNNAGLHWAAQQVLTSIETLLEQLEEPTEIPTQARTTRRVDCNPYKTFHGSPGYKVAGVLGLRFTRSAAFIPHLIAPPTAPTASEPILEGKLIERGRGNQRVLDSLFTTMQEKLEDQKKVIDH